MSFGYKLKYLQINTGAQTERSKRNFPVGKEQMPIEVVYGFAQLKRGAALANHELGKISDAKKMQSYMPAIVF